jgi:TP901 family phage tail tape measure protein
MSDLPRAGVQLVADDQAAFKAALAAATGAVNTLGMGSDSAAAQIDKLTGRITFQQRSLNILQQELAQTTTKYGEGSIQAQKKQLAVDKLTASIARDEKALEQLKAEETAAASSSTKLAQGFEHAGQSSSRFGEVMTGALRQIGTLVVNVFQSALAAMGRFVSGSIEAATQYEKTMHEIVGLTGTSQEAVAGLSDQVLKLAGPVAQAPQELADGLYFILSSGIDSAHAMDVLTASAKAASAGLGETKTVADLVTSVMNAYGAANITASQATDILTQAVKDGKGEPDAYASAMGRVLPIAAAAGVSFQEVAASLATMTRTGLDANEATTALRGILGGLESPSNKTRDALHDLGLSADDVRKSLREKGLLASLQMLMERSGGNMDTLSKLIPNVRALTGVLSTAGSQSEAYAQILGDMQNAEGATDKAFQEASKSAEFQRKAFGAAMGALQVTIGNVALPALTALIKDGIVPTVGAITDFVNATRDGQTWLSDLARTVQAVALPVIMGLTAALTAYALVQTAQAIPALIASIPAIVAQTAAFAANALAVAAALAPYALIAIAVAGITAAYKGLQDQLASVTDKVLAGSGAWQDSVKALAAYDAAGEEAKAAASAQAEALRSLQTEQRGAIEQYALHTAAYQEFGEASGQTADSLEAERLAINARGDAIIQGTSALKGQLQAQIDAQAASMTATGQIYNQTQALADNQGQIQLTEEELKELGKQLEKTTKEGTQAVQDYVSQAASLMEQLTDTSKKANDRITVDQAIAYANQAAAQRAHLGDMLAQYTIAERELGHIQRDQADIILSAIEKQFGATDATAAQTFRHFEQIIDSASKSGKVSIDSLSTSLGNASDAAINLKVKADALKGKYTAELVHNFNPATDDVNALLRALEQIPKRVNMEIHTSYTESGNPPQHGGQQGDAVGGPIGQGEAHWVGEQGRELFMPSASGAIIPHDLSMRLTSPPASAQQIHAGGQASAQVVTTQQRVYNYSPTYATTPRAPAVDFMTMAAFGS